MDINIKCTRETLKKLTSAIVNNNDIKVDDAKEYLAHVQEMFSYEAFKNFTVELEQLNVLGDERAIKLLTDCQMIESKELAKIAEGRIKFVGSDFKDTYRKVVEWLECRKLM